MEHRLHFQVRDQNKLVEAARRASDMHDDAASPSERGD